MGVVLTILIQKHCRSKQDSADGRRILVMRQWPRGLARSAVDAWEQELAPSLQLLQKFRALSVGSTRHPLARLDSSMWWALIGSYLQEIAPLEAKIRALRAEHLAGATLTLLCACHYPAICHRSFLATVIEGTAAVTRQDKNDAPRLL